MRRELDENTAVDIVGYIGTYFPIKDIEKKDGTKSKIMTFQVKDLESRSINLTLWDSYAKQMSDYLLTHKDETNVVIVLHFGMFKTHEGRPGVSNSFHITKLIINEDIPDINLFKKSLFDIHGNDASSSSRSTSPTMKISLHDDFVANTKLKTIAQLDEIKAATSVIVFGTIMPISRHTKWYYDACKICHKQVIEILTDDQTIEGDDQNRQKVYECLQCNEQVAEVAMRYKIPINVKDSTGVVTLILWDWEANNILKKSAKALYDEIINGDVDMDLFPDDLKNLENQSFGFKIDRFYHCTNALLRHKSCLAVILRLNSKEDSSLLLFVLP